MTGSDAPYDPEGFDTEEASRKVAHTLESRHSAGWSPSRRPRRG